MSNPNNNCLAGMACPKCGSYGPFRIGIQTVVIFGDEGTIDSPNDQNWDDNSFCGCCECTCVGTVSDFYEDEDAEEEEDTDE